MDKQKNTLAGCNEYRLCENEAKKAFVLYFERLMPNTEVNITSIVHHDHQFVIKTTASKGEPK